ncbi:MAG: HD-GYP domain-containing protein [Candidatus Polarisedimenticolaceae bacterium]|nr:HD-GYP domain-containing protein [Candidatus Polarisedimenticolaceae bacterium]
MIKKIPTTNLRLKMYVYDLNCDWTQHPFALREFKITSQEQIDVIIKAGITELYIDTDKGVDIEAVDVEKSHHKKADAEQERVTEYITRPLLEELPNAINVRNEMISVLLCVMDEVRQGHPLPMDDIDCAMENMASSFANNSDASIGLMRIKKTELYTVEHAVNAAILMMAFEKSLTYDLSQLIQVGLGGLLMDIGKAKLPRYIMEKSGRLTKKEREIACRHVQISCDILSHTPGISDIVLQIAAEHHERLDGSGYPAKKRGDDITLYGQMAAIVDVYDSLTADRIYKKGITPHAALSRLVNHRKQFNHELVQRFIHCIGVYPVGSLVALPDGRFAVVVESDLQRLLSPKIRVIYDSLKRKYVDFEDIDMAAQDGPDQINIVGAVDPHKWNIKPENFLDGTQHVT